MEHESLDAKIARIDERTANLELMVRDFVKEDKSMHRYIYKWLAGLTIFVIIDAVGGGLATQELFKLFS